MVTICELRKHPLFPLFDDGGLEIAMGVLSIYLKTEFSGNY
jgi:hypothetical protein